MLITAANDFRCPNLLHSKRILPERRHHRFGALDGAKRGEGCAITAPRGILAIVV
jgi:hypothetical protein